MALFNGKPGDPRSFDLLDDLLEHQCYRLSYWRVALRRDQLPPLLRHQRPGRPQHGARGRLRGHARPGLRLLAEGKVDGLRIDHPDGLYDPAQYFRRLQEHYVLACARQAFERRSGAPGRGLERGGTARCAIASGRGASTRPAEGRSARRSTSWSRRSSGRSEPLAETWPVHGTSGYDFLNQVNGLFVDGGQRRGLHPAVPGLGRRTSTRFAELVYRKKLLIMQVSLSSELHMLTHQLDRLAQKIAALARLHLQHPAAGAARGDRLLPRLPLVHRRRRRQRRRTGATSRSAVRRADGPQPAAEPARVSLHPRHAARRCSRNPPSDDDRAEQRRFAGKFQQVTAPVMAKGVEDTAFYVYNRLVSLNEVGGDPDRFGVRPEALHAYNQDRQASWPYVAVAALNSRHQAQRGRPRPDQRAVRDARGMACGRRALEPPQRAAPPARSRT